MLGSRDARDPARMAWHAALWAGGMLLLFGLTLSAVNLSEVGTQLSRLDAPLLLAVLGLSLVNYTLRCLRWQVLSRAGGLRVPLLRNSLYYFAGFAFAVTPGKLGEVVRLWLLRRHHGAPYRSTAGLLVVDRLSDALPLVVLCLPGTTAFAGQAWGLAAAGAIVLTGLTLAARPGLLAALIKLAYTAARCRPRLFAGALQCVRSLRALAAPRVLAVACGLGLAGWSAEILGAWFVLDGVGANVGLAAVAFVFAFSMLVGSLPLFPGGVGGAEGTMVTLLLLLGVDLAIAIAVTAIIRLATLGFAVALGLTSLPFAVRAAKFTARADASKSDDSRAGVEARLMV